MGGVIGNIKGLVCGVAFSLMPCTALAEVFACEDVIGKWQGDHTYANGVYTRWQTEFKRNGLFVGRFFDRSGRQVEAQSGLWGCDGLFVMTRTVSSAGENMSFTYRIETLEADFYRYIVVADDGEIGPIFDAYRVLLP